MNSQTKLKKLIKNETLWTTTLIEGKENTFKFVNDYGYNEEIINKNSKINIDMYEYLIIPVLIYIIFDKKIN